MFLQFPYNDLLHAKRPLNAYNSRLFSVSEHL